MCTVLSKLVNPTFSIWYWHALLCVVWHAEMACWCAAAARGYGQEVGEPRALHEQAAHAHGKGPQAQGAVQDQVRPA